MYLHVWGNNFKWSCNRQFLISAEILYQQNGNSNMRPEMQSKFNSAKGQETEICWDLVRNCIVLKYLLMATSLMKNLSISGALGKIFCSTNLADLGKCYTMTMTRQKDLIVICQCFNLLQTKCVDLKLLQEKDIFPIFPVVIFNRSECTQLEITYNREFID